MKKIIFVLLIIISLLMISCSTANNKNAEDSDDAGKVLMITPEKAKENLEENEAIVLLDVRSVTEYEAEHIKGAVLLPLDEIAEKANEVIPDQKQVYYVYCRSGNRSATAAQLLVDMGYEKIYDLGGIIDWPYDTVKE